MATSAVTERREVAHRIGNGIEVILLWSKSTKMVTIAVVDAHSGEKLEFEVDGSRALYTPAFQKALADARIEDLHRARSTSRPYRSPAERTRRAAARWGSLRAGMRRPIFADLARATGSPRS